MIYIHIHISDFPNDEWRHIKTLPTEELFGPPLFGAPWQCFLSPWFVRWWFGGCGSGWFGAIQPRPWLGVACRLATKGVGTLGWKFGGKNTQNGCGCLDSKTPEVCAWNSASLWFPGTCCWCYLCHRFPDAAGMEQAGTHWAYVDCTSAIPYRWEIWSQVLGGGDAAALHVQQVCGCLPTVLRLRRGVENLRIC